MYVLRRFYVLVFFVLGGLIAVGLASPFATQGEGAPAPSRDRAQAGIYFRSQRQADESLARFDRDNPRCQLWTNWQRMCSRTGANGATHCVGDPAFPARLSRPFCVRPPSNEVVDRPETTSRDRFCAQVAGDPGSGGLQPCGRYVRDRPFNGFHLSAARSPVCRRWVHAATRRPICEEGGEGRMSCAGPAARRIHDIPLACAELVASPPCAVALDWVVQHFEAETIDVTEVYFDTNMDGFVERVGWAGPDDGLLARDLNDNGLIDNLSELFGTETVDGFTILAGHDSNDDGLINAGDAIWSTPRVWRPRLAVAYPIAASARQHRDPRSYQQVTY